YLQGSQVRPPDPDHALQNTTFPSIPALSTALQPPNDPHHKHSQAGPVTHCEADPPVSAAGSVQFQGPVPICRDPESNLPIEVPVQPSIPSAIRDATRTHAAGFRCSTDQ